MVYLVGSDHVAQNKSDVSFRNQLFVALTRARGWANLSGGLIEDWIDSLRLEGDTAG